MPNESVKSKVLIVEDDVFMIDLMMQEFSSVPEFAVSVARTGSEGVKKFEEVKPDITLLDLMLPDKKGFEALRAIRRTPAGAHAKVIIFSNSAEASDVAEAKRLGAIDYMIKANFSLDEIVGRTKKALAE
ncbi:MAG: response regulator [bacterium]|nr:response regulator [bacterium]MDZ4299437.1 response regulator [Candidatus Sungbacteria bacterium]